MYCGNHFQVAENKPNARMVRALQLYADEVKRSTEIARPCGIGCHGNKQTWSTAQWVV